MSGSSTSSMSSENLQELNETVERLSSNPKVEAVLILNRKGDIVAGGADAKRAVACQKLLETGKRALQINDEDEEDVSFLQIRSSTGRELMIAPHEGFCLVVVKKEVA